MSKRRRTSQGAHAISNGQVNGTRKMFTHNAMMQEHAMLRALRLKQCMTMKEAEAICEQITGNSKDFIVLIGNINRKLKLVQLKIKIAKVPIEEEEQASSQREDYVALINTSADEAATRGCNLSFAEMSFFKQIIDAIASQNGSWVQNAISINTILNIEPQKATVTEGGNPSSQSSTQPSKNFTTKQKEILVNKLHIQGWLHSLEKRRHFYCLGPRSFLELKPYLMKLDLSDILCKELDSI